MKKIVSSLIAVLLLTPAVLLSFTACENPKPEINITMQSDFSKIIDAINDMTNTLSQKLTLIESAVSDGFADSQTAQEMIRKALETMGNTPTTSA